MPGRLSEGRNDPRIGAAAADIPLHVLEDLLAAGIRILLQQRYPGHDHPGRAVAALHGARLEKSFLQRMQPAVALETLDGDDRLIADAAGRRHTGAYRAAVYQHRATAALPFPAAVLGAREVEIVAQDAEKRPRGVCVHTAPCSVHIHFFDPGHES